MNRLPAFNNLDVYELPDDFRSVVEFRLQMDKIEEIIGFYTEVSEPPEYVKVFPLLFNQWHSWAKTYRPVESNSIRPFGEPICPSWMRVEFNDLEDFYQFLRDLLGDEV